MGAQPHQSKCNHQTTIHCATIIANPITRGRNVDKSNCQSKPINRCATIGGISAMPNAPTQTLRCALAAALALAWLHENVPNRLPLQTQPLMPMQLSQHAPLPIIATASIDNDAITWANAKKCKRKCYCACDTIVHPCKIATGRLNVSPQQGCPVDLLIS